MERLPLDVPRLHDLLAARWARVDVVEQTASTNADLLADADAPDRSALAAEHQTAGRGRFDRNWTSPPRAGLTFSALLRPAVPAPLWGWLPLLVGVALQEAVTTTTDVATRLKWPNDLLAAQDGRKLAGILVQTSGDAVVVGIGVNVHSSEGELPDDAATSLALCGANVDRTELLAAILTRLDARCAQWTDHGGDAAACGLAAAYRSACATLGRPVRVTLAGGTGLNAEVVDVDDLGRLILRTAAGEQPISAGDVEHLRPA